jgi:histidyl-tRNA synthetase
MQKPSIPKGTRDFTPAEMLRREYIFSTIKAVFKKFGYSPIETPAMENLSTLLGKYGEEGDKLLFKILNSGDYLAGAERNALAEADSGRLSLSICEKGLRYDLTVPFARYVVQHRNEITFPFKRYQIQPVWRADRPQKGRYREFYQCDADIVGSTSLLNEIELLQIIEEVFSNLKINVTVKLNNRKILAGIAEVIGQPERLTDITVAIDKLDKIGLDKVIEELNMRGFEEITIEKLRPFLKLKGESKKLLDILKPLLKDSSAGIRGLEEMESILGLLADLESTVKIEFDLTLARGLNYYTGTIIEVKADNVDIGSIGGGGRYDDLTGIFGLPDVSGVGVSFGADRIYDVLHQLELFPEDISAASELLLTNFGGKEQDFCLKLLRHIRKENIRAELYPDPVKLKKQLAYADAQKIPYVLIVGEEETKSGKYTLKNMKTGKQDVLDIEELVIKLNEFRNNH